jgi:ribonuclease HII
VGDSKKISPARRETLAALLRRDKEIMFQTASVSSSVIDKVGISKALRTAVARGLKSLGLSVSEMEVRLDGRLYAPKQYAQSTVVRGDATEWIIGAASIVAKVHRDTKMVSFDKRHPKYGFARHKGYGTKAHYAAIKKYGPCSIHRRSFLGRILRS